jgi:integrase
MTLWKEFRGDSPCTNIDLFEEHERERYIQEDELPRFFTELAKVDDDNFKDYIALSLFTGARRENVLGMRWKDIDFATGLWSIVFDESKNTSNMTVHLTAPSIETLENRKARVKGELGTFVFPAKSKSGHMTAPKKPWAALLKAAELDNLRLHDLRRTLGSWTANTGGSLQIIGKALGHKSVESTLIYARLQGGAVKSALDMAATAIMTKGGILKSNTEVAEQTDDVIISPN